MKFKFPDDVTKFVKDNEAPVVAATSAGIRRLAVAMWFHFRPLGVRQHKSFHLLLESQTSPRRNPEPQQPLSGAASLI